MNKNFMYRLYYLFASLDLVTIFITLGIAYNIYQLYDQSFKENDQWISRIAHYQETTKNIILANAPGNRVFDTMAIGEEKKLFDEAYSKLEVQLASMLTDELVVQKKDEIVIKHIRDIQMALSVAKDNTYKIFNLLERKDTISASKLMAKMDASFHNSLRSILALKDRVTNLQRQALVNEHNKAKSMFKNEFYVSFLVFFMLIAALFYGKKLKEQIINTQKTIFENDKLLQSYDLALNKHSGVMKINSKGIITYVNDKFCQISGYSKEELIGVHNKILDSGYHRKIFFKKLWADIKLGKTWRGQIKNKKKDGGFYWVDVTITPLVNKRGEIREFLAIKTEITEQKKLEKLAQDIQHIAKIGGWEFDVHTEKATWTDVTYKIHDIPIGTPISGHKAIEFYPDHEKERVLRTFKNCIKNGEPFDDEFELFNAKGKHLWVRSQGYPEFDREGRVNKIVGTFQDVTDFKESVRRLKESTTYLDLALEGAGLGIWDWNLTNNAVKFDDRWASMLGLDINEISMSLDTWEKRVHPDDLEQCYVDIKAYLAGQSDFYENVHRMRHKDGHWVHILDKGRFSQWDSQGKPTRFTGTHLDISAYEVVKHKLSLFFDKANFGFAFCSMQGEILEVNKEFCKIIGYSEEEVRKLTYWDLTPIKYEQQEKLQLESMQKTGRYGPYRKEYIHKNGTLIPVELNGFIVKEYDGAEGIWSIIEDITEKIESEKKVIEARDQAILAEKAKSDFLANMSHEIRTPMNGVLGMVQLLSDTKLSAEQREMIDTIKNSGDILLSILNDILDLSKIDAGKIDLDISEFDLRKAIKDVYNLYIQKAYEKDIKLHFLTESTDLFYQGDIVRIKQIIVNFLSNAMKFTARGEINVAINTRSLDQSLDQVRISVQDSGIGIGAEGLKTLFNPFTQADSSTTRHFGGTGLGLSICHKLAKLMGGQIIVESRVGKGSEFILELNLTRLASLSSAKAEESVSDISDLQVLKQSQILVVEDNAINQRLATLILSKLGYSCDIASNGVEALEKTQHKKFDLIFMDLQMPLMDGFTATKELYKIFAKKTPPIVAMTANVFSEDREKCFEAGMVDFISKPIEINELKRVLFEHLSQQVKAS